MEIKLYSIITCTTCLLLKSKLETSGINFEIIDGDQYPDETSKVMKLAGSMMLPILQYTLDNEDHYIVGYDEENIDKLIKLCNS